MKVIWFKRIALMVGGVMMAAVLFAMSAPVRGADDDAAALYNTKCKMCHGATGEKKIDKTKADEMLAQIILDGKTAEKPPNMPKFSERGLTADQAKALVAYIKSLK